MKYAIRKLTFQVIALLSSAIAAFLKRHSMVHLRVGINPIVICTSMTPTPFNQEVFARRGFSNRPKEGRILISGNSRTENFELA
jgi:hypothetical protein